MYAKVDSPVNQTTYNPNHTVAANPARMDESQRSTDGVLNHLARLSRKSKWILFTAQCQRPTAHWAKSARFTTSRLVHMMPSRHQSEKEIVLKALQAGTASAVIASEQFSEIDKRHLKQRAFKLGCELYFMDELSTPSTVERFH